MARSARQFIDERTGFMSPKVFEETIELLFSTKKEFSEFTGISQAQVQRYAAGVSQIPKSVALLVLSMGILKRRGIAMPDLEEVGVIVRLDEHGTPSFEMHPDLENEAHAVDDRPRPGRRKAGA